MFYLYTFGYLTNNINFGESYDNLLSGIKTKQYVMHRTIESYFKCVVIPASLRDRVIDMFHTNFHLGIRSTYIELRRYCYWERNVGRCKI